MTSSPLLMWPVLFYANSATRMLARLGLATLVMNVSLWLSLIAYSLGNLWRRLALPKGIGTWSLTTQQRLVKTGGRLTHLPPYWLLLAASQPYIASGTYKEEPGVIK